MKKQVVKKAVLAYSGGLDTSIIVTWLKEEYGCEVICFTADIGQGEELASLPTRAKASGASRLIAKDLREEFAREYVFPLLRSGAIYEDRYLLGTSVARPSPTDAPAKATTRCGSN
jgi:argininosuccinate synthase